MSDAVPENDPAAVIGLALDDDDRAALQTMFEYMKPMAYQAVENSGKRLVPQGPVRPTARAISPA